MPDKLERRENLLKKVLYICAAIYIITLVYALYHNFMIQDYNAL